MLKLRGLSGVLIAVIVLMANLGPAGPAEAGAPSAELSRLQAAAQALYREGAFAEALVAAEKVVELTRAEHGDDSEATAIQEYGAGLVAERAEKPRIAERHYAQSVRLREKIYGADSPAMTEALARLGDLLLRDGRVAEAEGYLQRVLKLRSAAVGADHAYTASAHAGLGDIALARGDHAAALKAYRQAIKTLSRDAPTGVVAQSLHEQDVRRHQEVFVGLAMAAWRQRNAGAGGKEASMEETFAAGQQAWTTSAASALTRMTARLKAGSNELGRSIRSQQELSERVLALHQEDMQALAAWSAVQRADPSYSRLLEEFRAASIAQARATGPIVQRQRLLVERLQDLLARCPPGGRGQGCGGSEAEREAISRELGSLSAEVAKGAPAITDLHARLQAAEAKLPGHAAFAAGREARISEQSRLERELAAARAGIVKAFPEFIALTEPKPLTVAQTQALLSGEEAVVGFLIGKAKSFVWVVTRERTDWAQIDAGAAELEADVAALRRGLDPTAFPESGADASAASRGAVVGGFDLERSHALYRKLFEAVGPVIAGKHHLLLVPTGPLASLPFQVLLTAVPRRDRADTDALRSADWLIRRHALSVLPSVPSLAALRGFATPSKATKPFLGIGDPILIGPDEAEDREEARGRRRANPTIRRLYRGNGLVDTRAVSQLVPLPETRDELREIAKALGASSDAIVLREAATVSFVKAAALDDFRIIEFATHGLVAGDLIGLAEPALVLTPPAEPNERDNGLLTASDVATLKLDAEWVVLSACNTAAGDTVGADALSGLARAFFYAGTRALLVSHWPVNSAATVALTTGTFRELGTQPRIGRAEALRRSMIAMIDRGRPQDAHPSLWAPFVVVGEGASRAH